MASRNPSESSHELICFMSLWNLLEIFGDHSLIYIKMMLEVIIALINMSFNVLKVSRSCSLFKQHLVTEINTVLHFVIVAQSSSSCANTSGTEFNFPGIVSFYLLGTGVSKANGVFKVVFSLLIWEI